MTGRMPAPCNFWKPLISGYFLCEHKLVSGVSSAGQVAVWD